MKVLVVHFEGAGSYTIPVEFIAENRADYYCERDPDANHIEEMEYALADEFELIEWAQNNLNWVDVEDVATFLPQIIEFDLDALWPNAEMEVIEI